MWNRSRRSSCCRPNGPMGASVPTSRPRLRLRRNPKPIATADRTLATYGASVRMVWIRRSLCALLPLLVGGASLPQAGEARVGETFDEKSPPGSNYDKADFRLWYPQDSPQVRAVLLLVPGSNDNGRSMVSDPLWQAFARRQQLALVGRLFTDQPPEQNFIEEHVHVS